MDIKEQIQRLIGGSDLDAAAMTQVTEALMDGQVNKSQQAALLTALACKGVTTDELYAAVRVLRSRARTLDFHERPLIDTCGTGGDGAGLFNVSTATAFVAAAAGAYVAKHGNRSISGNSGSADLMRELGADVHAEDATLRRCMAQTGVAFLFAPMHHSSMKHVGEVRAKLGFKTVFNLLGPMLNPAGVKRQVIGVFAEEWLEKLALVLLRFDPEHIWLVHAEDQTDEISTVARTDVVEIKNGVIQRFCVDPVVLGLQGGAREALRVGDCTQSLAMIEDAFNGHHQQAAELIAINAAAALVVAGLAQDIEEGLSQSRELIASGKAAAAMQRFRAFFA